MNLKKPSRIIITTAVALAAVLSVSLAVNRASGNTNFDIPDITATETIDGAQATALRFGYSWYDGKNGVEADAIASWQGEYTNENTLVIDGEMGQSMTIMTAIRWTTVSTCLNGETGRGLRGILWLPPAAILWPFLVKPSQKEILIQVRIGMTRRASENDVKANPGGR